MVQISDAKDYVGLDELKKDKGLWKCLVAEFVGTLFLVFIGTGSCLSGWNDEYAPSMTQIAFAFGIIVATMAQAIGHVSGCHINPAITCGMLVARQVSVVRALLYILLQSVGAIVGSAILMAVTPVDNRGNLGLTLLHKDVTPGQGFGIELLITFILVLTVFGVCDDLRNDIKGSAPLAIGLSITACHLVAVPMTGSSMNPARTLGPAIVTGIWEDHWVYWAGPIAGGIAAALLYTYVFRAPKPRSDDVELESYKTQNYN